MQLPKAILDAVRKYFDPHHPLWHLARMSQTDLNPAEIPIWQRARAMFPELAPRNQPGSGQQFLEFHREMMREYKWMLQTYPRTGLQYDPWRDLPANVRAVIERGFRVDVAAGLRQITTLTRGGTLDELGGYIEPAPIGRRDPGAGLHDVSHGAVAQIEGGQTPREASMSSPSTAHRNRVFYQLHGWIDELYADWQRQHGQTPQLAPKPPSDLHGGDDHAKGSLATEVEEFSQRAAAVIDRLQPFPVPSSP